MNYTEDDLRLAFEAGSRLGREEAMLDEGYGWPQGAEHVPTWEQYLAKVQP